jgi:hypothetical protein
MVSINTVLGSKERMNQANNDAAVAAANAAAQGQANAAWNNSAGNVLGTIWGAPANFGAIQGGIFGDMAGNVGQQGANYANTYGGLQGGLSNLGNAASNNFGAYAAGLQGLAASTDPFGANSQAEIARQTALGNMASGALGAYGGAMNAALGAYGLQQQAYNLAMSQAMNANQSALSGLGQSRNSALAGLGNAYAGLGGAAAQLGGAGLQASQQNRTETSSDRMAENRQTTGSTSSDQANMYGSDGGYGGGGGFTATGPGGQISAGQYSPGVVGGGYSTGGTRTGSSSNYGSNESTARQADRASQVTGPQMDAFNAALGAGMSGIGGALGGLYGAQAGVMDGGDRNALMAGYNTGVGSLNRANEGYYDERTRSYVPGGRDIPGLMANQALAGLLALGQQGYGTSNRGMDQYYANAAQTLQNSPQSQAMGMLGAGYGAANNMLGGIGSAMGAGFRDTTGRIDDVRGDIREGADDARGDVQGLYKDSIGEWMDGNFGPSGLTPRPNKLGAMQDKARELRELGWTYDAKAGQWVSPDGRNRLSGVPMLR